MMSPKPLHSLPGTVSVYRSAIVIGLLLIVAGCMIGVFFPAGTSWDFANFYDAGHKALVGQTEDLFKGGVLISGQAPQGNMLFLSAPISSYLYTALPLLGPDMALIAFKFQNALALWFALFLLYTHSRRFVIDEAIHQQAYAAIFVVMALVFQPLWTVFPVGGQTTPTVLVLLMIGLLCHISSRFELSALCWLLAVLIKPVFAPGMLFLALVSNRRFFFASLAFGGVIGGLSVALMGWDVHEEFLATALREANTPQPPQFNSALYAWLDAIWLATVAPVEHGSRTLAHSSAIMILRGGIVCLFAWLYLGARKFDLPPAGRQHLNFILGAIFALMVTPTAWAHYLSILLIFLTFIVANRQRYSNSALWIIAAIFVLSLGQNILVVLSLQAWLGLDTAVEKTLIALLKSAPLLLTLLFLCKYRNALYTSYSSPIWNRA